jgi:site-specific DNA-methyltransferase (adenine-specific)
MIRHELLKVCELKPFFIREIREGTLEKLKERIKERGYNQAKSLTVVETDEGYIVADGNHRLKVLVEEGVDEVPCVIYSGEGDIYNLAVQANVDEDTYAPMDLFDWLDVVKRLKEEGKRLKEIGDKLGWEEGKVKQYSVLLNKVTNVLDFCKKHQLGRVTEEFTTVTFNFTERWFRDSGLYNLNEKYQQRLIQSFITDKFNWNKSKVQSESAKYKLWQEMLEVAKDTLANQDDFEAILYLVESGTFKTIEQLKVKVSDLNKKASNKLICGDALIELEKLEDGSIDLVITDPPYGIDYSSNRSQYSGAVTKETIKNDGFDDAVDLLKGCCDVLSRKTKKDSHLYFFTSHKVYSHFEKIISQYFDIKNMIVWDKGNHGAGDLEGSWGNRHELIIFATKGNRKLNKRKADIIQISKISSEKMIHPTQKPEQLIKELIDASAQKADTICDPFMGSGSTIKAIKEFDGLNYIGIEVDKERFEKAKSYIGGA